MSLLDTLQFILTIVSLLGYSTVYTYNSVIVRYSTVYTYNSVIVRYSTVYTYNSVIVRILYSLYLQ